MYLGHRSILSLSILFAGVVLSPLPRAHAQHEAGNTSGPSKYLFLNNVELKPGQTGAFAKLESEEIEAMRAAKAPGNFIGMWSITGSNHVLFTHGFDAFADLQKVHDERAAMTKLQETIEADNAQEGQLEVSRHSSVYSFEKDLSLNVNLDLSKMRFMRIILFHIRDGHDDDWQHLVKQVVKTYQASLPNARWAMFQKMYGEGSGNTYILVTPIESLGAVDTMISDGKKFREGAGEDWLAMFRNGVNATVESEETDLFALGQKISYVQDSWLTSSPDFWGKK
jgi:hypothetical protein